MEKQRQFVWTMEKLVSELRARRRTDNYTPTPLEVLKASTFLRRLVFELLGHVKELERKTPQIPPELISYMKHMEAPEKSDSSTEEIQNLETPSVESQEASSTLVEKMQQVEAGITPEIESKMNSAKYSSIPRGRRPKRRAGLAIPISSMVDSSLAQLVEGDHDFDISSAELDSNVAQADDKYIQFLNGKIKDMTEQIDELVLQNSSQTTKIEQLEGILLNEKQTKAEVHETKDNSELLQQIEKHNQTIEELESQLEGCYDDNEKLSQSLDQSKKEKSEFEVKLQACNLALVQGADLAEQLETREHDIISLKQQLQKLENELNRSLKENETLITRNIELNEEGERKIQLQSDMEKEQFEFLKKNLENKEVQCQEMEHRLLIFGQEKDAEIDQLSRDLRALRQEYEDLQSSHLAQVEDLRTDADTRRSLLLTERGKQIADEKRALNQRIQELEQDLTILGERFETVNLKLDLKEKELKTAQESFQDALSKGHELQNDLDEMTKMVTDLERENSDGGQANKHLQTDSALKEETIQLLEQELQDAQGHVAELTREMAELRAHCSQGLQESQTKLQESSSLRKKDTAAIRRKQWEEIKLTSYSTKEDQFAPLLNNSVNALRHQETPQDCWVSFWAETRRYASSGWKLVLRISRFTIENSKPFVKHVCWWALVPTVMTLLICLNLGSIWIEHAGASGNKLGAFGMGGPDYDTGFTRFIGGLMLKFGPQRTIRT